MMAKGNGAAAYVVTSVHDLGDRFESRLLGARGQVVLGARSAFHTEVVALDRATEFLTNLALKLQKT